MFRFRKDGAWVDSNQYYSQLLRDVGLKDVRKAGGWKEIFSPYDVYDYRGLLEEYKAL